MSDLSRVEQLLRNALGEDIYEVTPQSRVEILLAQLNELIEGLDTSVDPEAIASIVTGWLAENIHDGAVVDSSLSVSGAAAESKKTGDEIVALKEELNAFTGEKTTASAESDWERGDFATSTGAETYTTNRIRSKADELAENIKSVEAINGYKFLAFAWSESEYLGIWTGLGFTKTSASGLAITSLDLSQVYEAGATKVRIVLIRSIATETIDPSEGVNLVYTAYDNYIPTIKASLHNVEDFLDSVNIPYQSGNIYQVRTDDVSNRYYYRNANGVLSVGVNTDYIGFIVPVIPQRTYTFTQSNLLLLKKDKTLLTTTGGNYDVAGVRTQYSGDAYYFAVSVRREDIPTSGYVMSMGDSVDNSAYSESVYMDSAPAKRILGSNAIYGSLTGGEEHIINGKFAPRDGYYAVFRGIFESFGTVTLKFNGLNVTNAVSISNNNIVIVSGIGNTITEPHGLNIDNNIAVLLELKNSVMYITVESDGAKYQYHCPWYWTGSRMSEIGVSASDMTFTDSKLVIRVASAKRSVWYFGDSYAEFNMDSRFPYYMAEYGFDENVMFNSVSGSSSAGANNAFITLLAYGNPKYAINALGMNDGSDTDNTTPNSTWLRNIQTFITICEQHDIIPVLCTIPTIPTVNNNGKNKWIKESGNKYVDMAGAVGANSDGNWYEGMIGADNIHPSPRGAVAQFMQLLSDMPEVM